MGRIIGVSGKKGSGKDTFFDIFSEYRPEYINVKFASKVKLISSILTGLPLKYFQQRKYYGYYIEDWDLTVREFMQKLATETMRDTFDSEVWIKSALADVSDNEFVIITDVRFMNEIEAIRNRGGLVIRIEPHYDGYAMFDTGDTHGSEIELDNYENFDHTIINDGTIEDFESQIKNFIEQMELEDAKMEST